MKKIDDAPLYQEAFAANSFYYEKALVQNYYKTLFSAMPQFALLAVIFSAMTVYALISSISSGNYLFLIAAVAISALAFLFIALYYRSTVKKSLARFLAKQEGSKAPNGVYLLKERIVVEECDGASHSLSYGEIEKVLEGKSLYVLAATDRRYVFLPKESFVKGSAEELFAYLRKNYPKIKLRVKKYAATDGGEVG